MPTYRPGQDTCRLRVELLPTNLLAYPCEAKKGAAQAASFDLWNLYDRIIYMGKISRITFIISVLSFFPFFVFADNLGQKVSFSVDSSFDLQKREEVTATMQKVSSQAYFYIDDNWWNGLSSAEKTEVSLVLDSLAEEFDKKIYPTLVSAFGPEWRPGIDNDTRVTVLFHSLNDGAAGYFNSGDEYLKLQNPESNQREMVYLNTQYIGEGQLNGFLAHEFTHLITYNQKEKTYGVSEDVWLNEARADYSSTLLGYDDTFDGSNLQARVKTFLEKPSDSLVAWENKKYDYGVINLFVQYLVENYGQQIITSSIFSKKTGVDSLNEALKKRGFSEDTAQIFRNWTVAVLANDCSRNPKYCFKNSNLKNVKVVPQLNFLPMSGESSLQFTNAIYDWSANWYKIVGGKGKLILEFNGQNEGKFSLAYLLCDFQDKCQVKNLSLDEYQDGKIVLEDFSKNYQSLIIIPAIQTDNSESGEGQSTYLFTWKVSSVEKTDEEKEAELIESLLAQIDFLKREIARLQAEIAAKYGGSALVCQRFGNNLYYGMVDNMEVSCLQQFLKSQGTDIYPEGIVSGNFWSKTLAAVIRFQEKYASEILAPTGLDTGTGYVGLKTREKMNQLLGK